MNINSIPNINNQIIEDPKQEILEDTYEDIVEEWGQFTQEEVDYLTQSPSELNSQNIKCNSCEFFQTNGSCSLVSGDINSNGYCKLYIENNSVDVVNIDNDDSEDYSLSQSIIDLESDEDFFYILSLLKDIKLPQYKFEALLSNLVTDLCADIQELSASKAVSLTKKDKSEKGGLTQKGRDRYNKSTGSHLRPPVNRSPKTPEDIRRQGQFLTRMYSRDKIPPLKKPDGKPTRYALQATVWNSPIPKTIADVKKLAAKGKELLKRYESLKKKKKNNNHKLSFNIPSNPSATDDKDTQNYSQTSPIYKLEDIQELPISLSNGMVKIPIAKKGNWFHDQHGMVSFTQEDFDQIKKESTQDVLGFTPYITYGHPTNLPYASVDAELKKGDLIGWEDDGEVLFGLFDAKEDAYNLIDNKDYEYSSGEFIRNYKDKFTGERKGTVLMRVALTNSPFIPFGDIKVETLSINSNNSSPTTIPFVIKLSTDSNIPNLEKPLDLIDKEIDKQINMTVQNIENTLVTETTVPVVKEEIVSEVKATPEYVVVKDEPITPAAPVVSAIQPSVDINELVKTLTNQMAENFNAQLIALKAESANVVNSLKDQVGTLQQQLVTQQEVTQQFSNSIAQKNRQQFYKGLAEKGVPPVLIQKFSAIESALNTNQKVIKLSNNAGETKDQDVLETIADLLVEATLTEPVVIQQFGQTMSVPQVNAMQSDMQKIIERNRALAAKQQLQ